MDSSQSKPANGRPFIPVRRSKWLTSAAQQLVRTDLFFNNRVHISEAALEILRGLPEGAGVVLASNHADETDPSVYLNLSRQCARPFIFMCNREAFDEISGLAGEVLQRLGYFSIERGKRDEEALRYAIDVVKNGKDFLVIFPEGEIYYMNEEVQAFHSGAVEIAMQAIVANRQSNANWTTYMVPMAIKYHYPDPIDRILEKRIARMEAHLLLKPVDKAFAGRLFAIQQTLLQRQKVKHQVTTDEANNQGLTQEVRQVQRAMLTQIEEKHASPPSKKPTIDRSWQLAAALRDSSEHRKGLPPEIHQDLEQLRVVAQLSSWRPHYYRETNSQDRLAEAVLKLERGLYGVERPKQLARRDVYLDIGSPIDLGTMTSKYAQEPHVVRQHFTDQCREQIQTLLDKLSKEHSRT
jgi:1-acyl-sn-glycerol-3-phosphate acyltransferase